MRAPPAPFVVSCIGCERILMTVDRIGDAEIDALKEHLRACLQLDVEGSALTLGAVMERVRVAAKSAEGPGGHRNPTRPRTR